jgi:hypothetical protein
LTTLPPAATGTASTTRSTTWARSGDVRLSQLHPTMPRLLATAGPPGTSDSTGQHRTRTGWLPNWPRLTPSSVCSRPVRRPTCTCCCEPCPARLAAASSPPSATAAPSTGCSTATPATSRAGEYAAPGRCGRWRGAPRSAVTYWPDSGRPPSSPHCAASGSSVHQCPTRCNWTAPSCSWSTSMNPTGRPLPGWRS